MFPGLRGGGAGVATGYELYEARIPSCATETVLAASQARQQHALRASDQVVSASIRRPVGAAFGKIPGN
jgi:hypothetical protein